MTLTFPPHPDHTDFWYWEARYDDGTKLVEAEGDKLNHFGDIDQEKIVGFTLLPLLPHLPAFAVDLSRGKRLIWLRRRTQQLSMNGEELGPGPTWHVLGWQETKHEANFKVYLYVREDGYSFLSDDHNAV